MTADEEKYKQAAMSFYDLMFNQCLPREAIDQFVGAEYIQHNPDVADGKEAFIEYFERMAAEFPVKKLHSSEPSSTAIMLSCIAIKNGRVTYRTQV